MRNAYERDKTRANIVTGEKKMGSMGGNEDVNFFFFTPRERKKY